MSPRFSRVRLLAALVATGGLLFGSCAIAAETLTYSDLLRRLVDLDRLPYLTEGEECDQFSSYDRRSRYDESSGEYIEWAANGDSGHYIRFDADAGEDVMAEMRGPGLINRIWSANPQGKIRLYLDDADPIELDFNQMFSGEIEPFRRPLVWQRRIVLGGDNPASDCYLPIPYQKSCKVTSVRSDPSKAIGQYFHIGYTTFVAGTKLPTFHTDLSEEEETVLAEICGKLSNCGWDPQPHELFWVRKTLELQAGQTVDFHEIGGPAIVCQVKAKATTAAERDIGRKVLLKVYWDDESEPGIWCPIGDFFGQSFAESPFASLPLGMNIGHWYSYWRMPFLEKARFAVASEARKPCLVTLDVGFRKASELPPNTGYFHAKWRREKESTTFDYPILECRGAGRFLGVAHFIDNVHGGWWGEGDEKIYVDGEKFPSFFGTGSEDYYGDAWGIRHFVNPYHGCSLPDPVGRQQSCYRWHINDSVPFRSQFKITIENYSATEAVHNDYASVAYWYQAKGGSDFFKPVSVAERLSLSKVFVPGAIEAEGLFDAGSLPSGTAVVEDLDLPAELSGGAGLKIVGKAGDSFELPIPVGQTDVYSVEASVAGGMPNASFELLYDGRVIGNRVKLEKGKANLVLKLSKPAPDRSACEVIVDYVLLAPYKNYVRDWMLIGPWDNTNSTGLKRSYPPEDEIALEKEYQGKADKVSWKKVRVGPNGVVNFLEHLSPTDNVVAYGYFLVTAPAEIATDLNVGSDDGVRVWINGKLVHDHRVDRALQPDQDVFPVTLKEGRNAVLVKVDQGVGDWGLCLRFRDPDEALKYSVEAP